MALNLVRLFLVIKREFFPRLTSYSIYIYTEKKNKTVFLSNKIQPALVAQWLRQGEVSQEVVGSSLSLVYWTFLIVFFLFRINVEVDVHGEVDVDRFYL